MLIRLKIGGDTGIHTEGKGGRWYRWGVRPRQHLLVSRFCKKPSPHVQKRQETPTVSLRGTKVFSIWFGPTSGAVTFAVRMESFRVIPFLFLAFLVEGALSVAFLSSKQWVLFSSSLFSTSVRFLVRVTTTHPGVTNSARSPLQSELSPLLTSYHFCMCSAYSSSTAILLLHKLN